MKIKSLYKKAKFKTRRALDKYAGVKWLGENIAEPCTHQEVVDPEIDHCVFGDSFTIYTENEIEKSVRKGRKELDSLPQSDGGNEFNFIVDVCFLHFEEDANGNKFGLPSNWEERGVSCVRSLHDAFRNSGVHADPNGTDSGINFGLGQVKALDGSTVWGDAFRSGGTGIRYSGTGGTPNAPDSGDVMEYIKKNVMNSWQDPTRYLIVSYPTINGSASISGYAWVAVDANHQIAGHFVRWNRIGHNDYMESNFLNGDNKTPIHEIGHSLGLYHTFHNTDSCGEEAHPILQGDRVVDTPPHTRYSRCGTDITELPSSSHMSYASSTYRKIFSAGQVERMQAVAQSKFAAMKTNPYYDWNNNNTNPEPPMIPVPTINPGELLYSQGQTVNGQDYDRNANAWFEAYVDFDENPVGTIWSAGGSGRGSFVGINKTNFFIARSGEGGSLTPPDSARIKLDRSLFAGKSGKLRYDIFVDKNAVRLRFDEGNTGEWDVDEQVIADAEWSEFSGGDEGGVGKVAGSSVAGDEVDQPSEFNGTIHWLLFSQENNSNQFLPAPINLPLGEYKLIVRSGNVTIEQL